MSAALKRQRRDIIVAPKIKSNPSPGGAEYAAPPELGFTNIRFYKYIAPNGAGDRGAALVGRCCRNAFDLGPRGDAALPPLILKILFLRSQFG